MSCVEVMYAQPYASYFAYQRPASTTTDPLKKYGVQKMSDHLDTTHYGATSSPMSTIIPKEEIQDSGKEAPQNTQYLTSNCVLLTYFSGDISTNVDDHFTRALNQPSSYTGSDSHGNKSTNSWKDPAPMSQRNFPPSFWNSNYQPPVTSSHLAAAAGSSHHDFSFGATSDPFMASSLHSMSSLHQDPWRYSLSNQAHTYTHHSMHDLAYSPMASSSRFNPHYSSLLPTGRLTGQCETLTKHSDSWSSRYHTDPLATNLSTHPDTHLHTAALAGGGIETSSHQPSTGRDLYWL